MLSVCCELFSSSFVVFAHLCLYASVLVVVVFLFVCVGSIFVSLLVGACSKWLRCFIKWLFMMFSLITISLYNVLCCRLDLFLRWCRRRVFFSISFIKYAVYVSAGRHPFMSASNTLTILFCIFFYKLPFMNAFFSSCTEYTVLCTLSCIVTSAHFKFDFSVHFFSFFVHFINWSILIFCCQRERKIQWNKFTSVDVFLKSHLIDIKMLQL